MMFWITPEQHLEAARNIRELFANAVLSEQHSDRKNAPSIKAIDRFRCDTNVGGEKAVAKITVKETLVDGNKIYSVELEALKKPADLNENTRNSQSTGSNDSTETTGNPSSTNGFSESSSTSTVPQKQQNVKGNPDTTVGDKLEDSHEHAEQEPRAKYSRDAENQLDNQGEKADNEDEVFTDYAELEKLAQAEQDKKEPGYYSKVKDKVDNAAEQQINGIFNTIVQNVYKNFLEVFNEPNISKDTHILLGDKRRDKVLNTWAVYANDLVEKPSNYKEKLKRFIPKHILNGLSREKLISYYNLYRNVAREMYDFGSYVYGELCEELARGRIGQYNDNDRTYGKRNVGNRRDLERIITQTRVIER